MKRAEEKDLYKTLAVGTNASDAEIKKCYRKKALKWHLDQHASSMEEEKVKAEKIFEDVNLAYKVLSDKEKRERYNSGVDVDDVDNPNAGPGGHGWHFGGGRCISSIFIRTRTINSLKVQIIRKYDHY